MIFGDQPKSILPPSLCAVALAAFLSVGAERAVASVESGPLKEAESLSLRWLDSYGLCPLALRTAQAESASILTDLGVLAASGGSSPRGRGDAEIEFHVVLLAIEPVAWGLERNVLGAVRGHDALRDVVFVFTPNVLRAAGRSGAPRRCNAARKHREVGRAVARIVVHELIHAVAPDHPHAGGGLMATRMSRDWLLAPATGFDRSCAKAFISRLGAARAEIEAGRKRFFDPATRSGGPLSPGVVTAKRG